MLVDFLYSDIFCFHPPDADELHVSNVTASSFTLRWSNPEPKLLVYFEVVVTRLQDHTLVVKTNVSGSEIAVLDVESSQTYHAVVTAYTAEGRVVSARKGIVTTSKFNKHNLQTASHTFLYN